MSAGVKIRPACSSDASALAGLSGQLGYPATEAEVSGRLGELMRHEGQAVFVAEEADGAVTGWVHAAVYRSLGGDPEGEIVGLVVDQARRGQGFGQRLMRAAEEWARGRGLRAMRLRSRVHRIEAHRFYERLGYGRLKEQIVLRKELSPERR